MRYRPASQLALGTDDRRESPYLWAGWVPAGVGHGVRPGASTALCGTAPAYLWDGPFADGSTARTVQLCVLCVALADSEP